MKFNQDFKVLLLIGVIIAGILILGNILPIYAGHADPFIVSYTITEYLSFSSHSKAIQEAAVHNAVTAWAEHINVEVVFIPDADKKDVFCWIAFTQLSELGAGGGRPGFSCQAEVSKNASQWYFSNHEVKPTGGTRIIRDAEVTLQHEIGHGFGLGHYGLGSCQMFASYGGSPDRHCDAELDRLQMLWVNVEPWPDVRTYDGAMKSFSAPSPVVKGDDVRLDFTIENRGTFFYNSIVWFYDWKDNKVIKSGPFYELPPGGTLSGNIFWDTTSVSLGEHKIRGCYLGTNFSDPEHVHMNDIDRTNDCIDIFIDVVSITPPPPDPVPEPEPEPPVLFVDASISKIELNLPSTVTQGDIIQVSTYLKIDTNDEATTVEGFVYYDQCLGNGLINESCVTKRYFPPTTFNLIGSQPSFHWSTVPFDTTGLEPGQYRIISSVEIAKVNGESGKEHIENDDDLTNDKSQQIITILQKVPDPIPPPPEPEPEPEPVPLPVNYFIDYEETISIADIIDVTHIVGPIDQSPRIIELETEVSDLKDVIVNLTAVINIANSVIADLNTLTTNLENNIILLNDEIISLTESRDFWQNQSTILSNIVIDLEAEIVDLVQGVGVLLAEISELNNIIDQVRILVTP